MDICGVFGCQHRATHRLTLTRSTMGLGLGLGIDTILCTEDLVSEVEKLAPTLADFSIARL
jgi:hypothetical protein